MIRSLEVYSSVNINWTILALDDETFKYLLKIDDLNLEVITLDSIDDLDLKSLRGIRPWRELCWTSAACLLQYVNSKLEKDQIAAYIDADCFFFHDISKTLQPLSNGGSIAIHEHRFSPDRIQWLERSGRFNVGLVAGVKGTEFDQCLARWRMQVLESCEVNPSEGKCGDQTYLNEWPELYSKLVILGEKGIGVAPWNLNNYNVTRRNGKLFVDNSPLEFFHFHGIEIGFINSNFAFYTALNGYNLDNQNYKLIYSDYVLSMISNINSRNRIRFKPKIKFLIWWIKAIITKQILFAIKK